MLGHRKTSRRKHVLMNSRKLQSRLRISVSLRSTSLMHIPMSTAPLPSSPTSPSQPWHPPNNPLILPIANHILHRPPCLRLHQHSRNRHNQTIFSTLFTPYMPRRRLIWVMSMFKEVVFQSVVRGLPSGFGAGDPFRVDATGAEG